MKLVIKNGRVMDPASGRDEVTNIWVEDEKIIGFGEHPEWAEEAEELNAEGCVVAPGLVDVHVLFRDPGFTYKEDLETGSRAASAGGLHGKYKTNCRHTRSPSGYFRAYKEPPNPCKTGLSGFKKF